ncbi:MAG: response regulator [Candidatus Micrarchaeaceae archaeon]
MTNPETTSQLLEFINEKQQITYNELTEYSFSMGIPESELKLSLEEMEAAKKIAKRNNGGIPTYYTIEENAINNVLIVEDDKNINRLIALSIGEGYKITQLYDGGEVLPYVRKNKPDLIILDLMLPNKDGLDICQTIKADPHLKDIIVIIVSAMDPTSNRFKGLKYGADYYIKKPFDPNELTTLVTIFLKKRGKRFDPLIDLPDMDGITKAIERSIKDGKYTIGRLRIENLSQYVQRFGEHSGITILRLISQLLQDIVARAGPDTYVGFLNTDEFLIAGAKSNVDETVSKIKQEFNMVMPFLLQDQGYKLLDIGIESLYESNEVPKLSLLFIPSEMDKLLERRAKILKSKGYDSSSNSIGSYTYEELETLFEKGDLDVKLTRDSGGVHLHIGKTGD